MGKMDAAVDEEVYALEAVYPGCWGESYTDSAHQSTLLSFSAPLPDGQTPVRLSLTLPNAYPASSPPLLRLSSRSIGPHAVTAELQKAVETIFLTDGKWFPNEPVLFQGIEETRELVYEWFLSREQEHTSSMPDALEQERIAPERSTSSIKITSSEPIVDRKSVFIGHVACVTSTLEVQSVLATLHEDRKVARATHNIWAYTFQNDKGVSQQDNDDDGETAAGGRLAHLLQLVHAKNVLVVVSRWYGGIHLGPDRFKHINQAARNALLVAGFIPDPQQKTVTK